MTHTELKKTPLASRCESAGGKMVDFHGWLLPVQFDGIIAEHKAVREAAGMFDVSHMGQIFVEGKDAWPFLQYINCNNIKNAPAAGTYSHILTEKGTIIDDAISFCLTPEKFLVVVNAACISEDFAWFQKQAAKFDVSVRNESASWGMIAVQGPLALEKVSNLISDVVDLPRFHIKEIELFGAKGYVTRTGYTGEDGVEIMLPAAQIGDLWDALLNVGVKPCGLGSRDVLRLEAGYLLNGADADQTRTPYEANCGWVVKLAKENFVGKAALAAQKEQGLKQKLTAFVLKSPGVPRAECKVYSGAEEIGVLTSGTYSPLFKGIAVGYARADVPVGSEVEIEIHGKRAKAEVVKTPFYKNRV
ncbi:MAG: glycine cleavage system aminomethyltransferase GcvT [Elusimicrobia bacterium]|nr:glycine cleavage system aminomethyltransferase GcvT [Elusimicrobiota bacterium]MDY6039208.1 glycine cleavage system aminomethyltransferase GcvT [Elusimicrobiaceae bacterium]